MALAYIWTQIISKVLLGEPSSVRKSVGIGLILVGGGNCVGVELLGV